MRKLRFRIIAFTLTCMTAILFIESFANNDHSKNNREGYKRYASITITSNTNWSSITTGSRPGGQPNCTDDITISGNAVLTIDVNNAQCQNLFVNKNDDGTSSQIKFNAGSQLTVCADVVVGSSLGTARAGVLDMTTGGVLKLNGSLILTPSVSDLLAGTGTIEYGATVAQTVTATIYNNLSTSGSLVKTLGGAITVNGNLSIGTGTVLDVSSGNNFPITLNGDWTNNGAFTQRTGTVTFNGSIQSIKGTTTTVFSTITILSGAVVTGLTASTASIANINSGGKYIQTAGSAILGSSSKNFAAGSFYELQLASASGFSFSGNTYGTLIINFSGSSGLNTNGVLTTVANDLIIKNTGTSAFRFASSQSPTVNVSGNLKIEGGTVEAATTTGVPVINVAGNFEQSGGFFKLSVSSTGGQLLNVNGSLLLNGGTFQPMTSTGIPTTNLKGDWINNGGSFIPSSSTINFNGVNPQTIAGGSGTNFNNLTISNAAGASLSTVDATVNGTLNFVNGKISTGSKKLILGSLATITGAGTGKYVNGVLRKLIPSINNFSFTFPIGDASNYAPVTIDFTGTTAGTGSLDASTISLAGPPVLSSGLSQTKYIGRKWIATNDGVTGFSSYNATFNFVDADKIGSPNTSNLVIRKFNGSDWSPTSVGILTANSSQATGLNSFSEFLIGEADCNFPNASNFIISSSNACVNSSATLQLNSSTLLNGAYSLNYDLTGANQSSNNNSPVTLNAVSGSFNTIPLSNAGSTTLIINSISSGNCLTHVTGNSIISVNAASIGDTTAIACDSFTWYGIKYFSSATPTHVFSNSSGCDSVVTLHLTVSHSTTSEETVVACNSYEWNGTVYTTSGEKTISYPNGNAAGCDSTAILHLTINHSTAGEETVVACGSYTWNGTVYTTSGDKTHLFPNGNAAGCDSSAILHLTIDPMSLGGSVSPNNTICANNSSGLLTLTGQTGSVLRWESSTDNNNWNQIANTSTNFTSSPLTQSTWFRAIVKNGSCNEQPSGVALITVNANVIAGTVSSNSPLCVGASTNYSSNGTTGGLWSSSNSLIATVNAQSGLVTALTAGNSDIIYTINNGCGAPVSSYSTLSVNNCNPCTANLKPVVNSINLSANSIPVNSSVTLTASFTDDANNGPYTVDIDWNDGSAHAILNIPGSATTVYNLSSGHTYNTSNVFEIKLRVTDGCNAISDVVAGTSTFQYLAVYVTGNDFTTMGGWFNTPAGSYMVNPEFTGRVNLGNVVRPNNPNNKGELELNINGQVFYVHTISPTNWDYLTISGCCLAMFKGSVTINNSGNYKILVVQTDKNANCMGYNGNNKIRVKIWNPLTNEVFFDTQPGDPDNALPLVSLSGGAIQVHKPSCNFAIKTNETKEELVLPGQFLVAVKPNPTENNFTINIQSSNYEPVLIKLSDVSGRLITILKITPGNPVIFGDNLKIGIYFAEISQGNKKRIIKLVKK